METMALCGLIKIAQETTKDETECSIWYQDTVAKARRHGDDESSDANAQPLLILMLAGVFAYFAGSSLWGK